MSDAEQFPHVRAGDYVWHRRPVDDPGDGPDYRTVCGITVRTYCVDVPEGPAVDERESLCENGCYR